MYQDFFNIPDADHADVQIFNASAGWQAWNRPRGRSVAFIFCLGSGASGGGGLTGAAGTARGGGGGGGSASMARMTIPIFALPDVMYVNVPFGGAGVAAGTIGNNGNFSCVSAAPNTTTNNVIIQSGTNGGAAGAAGTAAGNNAGGSGASAIANSNVPLSGMGVLGSLAGQTGSNSGTITGANGSNGAQVTLFNNSFLIVCAGTGGATVGTNNTNFAGGQIQGGGIFPTITGGAALTNGGDSFLFRRPFVCYGGLGGGSAGATATIAGNGGAGAFGCGGGGGGGGATGGRGGQGGPGLVIIVCW